MSHDFQVPPHEADALLRIARVQGSMNLFGSPIRPLHFITLEVNQAERHQGLGHTRYYPGKLVLEIAMSEVQFAEAITTLNSGVGTPCTLRYSRSGEELTRFEEPPAQESSASLTREEFHRDMKAKLGDLKRAQEKVSEMLVNAKVSDKRRAEIEDVLGKFMRLYEDSAPFMMKQFEANTEQSVAAAKAEIGAHADFVLRQAGINAFQQLDSGSQT